jgi:predicted Zn-dependent protease
VELQGAAADAEDLTDKAAVTPGPIAPARELLGYMLLDAGRAKEAQAAVQATIIKEPGRFLGLHGAARAAEALGDRAGAAALCKKLFEQAGAAATDREAIGRARQQTASR